MSYLSTIINNIVVRAILISVHHAEAKFYGLLISL